MSTQLGDTVITTVVEKLNSYGVSIDVATVKKAIANYPQLLAQIQAALASSDSKEKFTKLATVIQQAAKGQYATGGTETTK